MLTSIIAICLGASTGAVLRWLLGLSLNSLQPMMPLGTLAANLIGGYLAGIALVIFTSVPGLAAEWRLLIVTGFLGGLTTFSAFSAEVTTLLLQGRLAVATMAITAHVGGSLLMTMAGVGTVMLIQRG